MRSTRFGKAVFTAALIAALVIGLAGCNPEAAGFTADDLNGTWTSGYGESYTINVNDKTFDGGSYSYAGDNMVIEFEGADYGYIYFIYTRAYQSLTESPYYEYSTTAPDVGNWYAVAFKNLTASSVELSGAYLATGKSSTETLAEAKTEFTVDNGYFAYYSSCSLSQ